MKYGASHLTGLKMAENTKVPINRSIRTPLDPLIKHLAARLGGEKSREVERFLKFAVVGVTGAIIDVSALIILQATVLPPDSDAKVALATTIAFVLAVTSNFTWNRFWVYPDSRSRSIRRQLVQFFLVSFIGWSGRTFWVASAYKGIGDIFLPILSPLIKLVDPQFTATLDVEYRIGSVIAQLMAMVIVMLWNFFVNRYWTYSDVE